MIADQYYLNGDYSKSIRFCTEGILLAQDSLVRDAEATLYFDLGRNLLMLDREDEGFRYYHKAVAILDQESRAQKDWSTADDYVYTLAILIGTLRNNEHYDRAIALLPDYDRAVRRLAAKDSLPPGLLDMRRASGYGMAAVLYAITGDKARADEQYRKLLATQYATTPDASQLIIPYLYQIGDYHQALHQLHKEKTFWQTNTDTVSYSYIENHLESELAVYEKLGDIRSANRVLHTIRSPPPPTNPKKPVPHSPTSTAHSTYASTTKSSPADSSSTPTSPAKNSWPSSKSPPTNSPCSSKSSPAAPTPNTSRTAASTTPSASCARTPTGTSTPSPKKPACPTAPSIPTSNAATA